MARTLADFMQEFGRRFPMTGPLEREFYCWEAIKDICNENDLSFMLNEAETKIITTAQYKEGTVSATDGSSGITLTGGTWSAGWSDRRIKIQGQAEIYDVTFSSATAGTLTGIGWLGATDSGLSYVIFRDSYSVPADMEYSKELLIWDTKGNCRVEIVDYLAFQRSRRETQHVTGTPTSVTRSGVKKLLFGPEAPSAEIAYSIDYYRKPTKPANTVSDLLPAWPDAYWEVIPQRAAWKYADVKGLARRSEFERNYRRILFDMKSKFSGSDEMSRRIQRSGNRDVMFHPRAVYRG